MPIQIHWPDGTVTVTTPTKGTSKMGTLTDESEMALVNPRDIEKIRAAQNPRTIATVATELQSAMDAAARVPKLRAELDGLLGRKRRGAKKGTP